MIERVDVLTGGASAVYGADAVAGVVNFVLNTHFEGVRIDVDYGLYDQNSDFAQQALRAKGIPVPGSSRAARTATVVHGRFELCRRQGQRHGLCHLPEHLTGVGNQYDYAGCTLNSPAPRRRRALWARHLRWLGHSATGRFLMLGRARRTLRRLTDQLRHITVHHGANGQFRPYTAADSYNYGAASYLSARPSAGPRARS